MYHRRYEIVVIINTTMGEAGADKALGRVREAIGSTDGVEIRLEDWGVRRLSYIMNKQKRAHYYYLQFLGSNTTVAEVERLLGITESVLKYQSVLLENRVKKDEFDLDAAAKELTDFGKDAKQPQEAA
ncbi:MAG: small subunit ribosomal protein S6 [Myxococcota bacterium]|jgi:small subunit ribosomal protein S6